MFVHVLSVLYGVEHRAHRQEACVSVLDLRVLCYNILQALASATPSVAYAHFARSLTWAW